MAFGDYKVHSTLSHISKESSFAFWNRTRIYIMILTLTCLTFIQINTVIFNFTVICMEDIFEDYNQLNNFTDTHWFQRTTEKSFLFSGAAIGGIIGLLPSVPLISSLGLRNFQTIFGFISALGALLFPVAVSTGFYFSLLCRILQGIGSSTIFTPIGVVPGVWAPSNAINTFTAILSCAIQLGNIICMPVAGLLCESSFGWRSIYYLFGGITVIIYIVFWFTYTDDPKLHRNVSAKELEQISTGKLISVYEPVPYLAMCKDSSVLITWITCFGNFMALYSLCLYGPTYLRDVLKFNVKETGFFTALPFILSTIVKCGAGQLSDSMKFLSEKVLTTSVDQQESSVCIGVVAGLVVMAFTSNRLIAQIAFNFAIVSSGLNVMGAIKCAQLRCLQHVTFAIAVISLTTYLNQFLAPVIVGVVCPDNTPEQWSKFFLIITGIVIICAAGFPFFSKSEAADYTRKREKRLEN